MNVYSVFFFGADRKFNMAAFAKNVLIGRYLKNLLLRNHRADLIMILQKCSLDGPVLVFSANQKTKMAVADVGFYIWENE